jgi:ABC transporter substrate binding protein
MRCSRLVCMAYRRQGADEQCKTALYLTLDGLFIARRPQIVGFALRQKIALFAPFPADAVAGALVAFGNNLDEQWRLSATHVDQILKGAKPADLPVQEPVKIRDGGQSQDGEGDRHRGPAKPDRDSWSESDLNH